MQSQNPWFVRFRAPTARRALPRRSSPPDRRGEAVVGKSQVLHPAQGDADTVLEGEHGQLRAVGAVDGQEGDGLLIGVADGRCDVGFGGGVDEGSKGEGEGGIPALCFGGEVVVAGRSRAARGERSGPRSRLISSPLVPLPVAWLERGNTALCWRRKKRERARPSAHAVRVIMLRPFRPCSFGLGFAILKWLNLYVDTASRLYRITLKSASCHPTAYRLI